MNYKKSKKIIPKTMLFLLIAISISVSAKNLGVIGEVYPIMEPDFLDFIQAKLKIMQQNDEITKVNTEMSKRVEAHTIRPKPVSGITTTKNYRTWLFDPSLMLSSDITDAEGNIVARAGSVFNPLTKVNLSEALLFYDADDAKQVVWAIKTDKKLNGKDKLILVNGSVLEQNKRFNKNVYFDQAGRLTAKFKIQHVPAIVTQHGLSLKIEEIVP